MLAIVLKDVDRISVKDYLFLEFLLGDQEIFQVMIYDYLYKADGLDKAKYFERASVLFDTIIPFINTDNSDELKTRLIYSVIDWNKKWHDLRQYLESLFKCGHYEAINKALYCLGKAMAEAFVLGISDRFRGDKISNMLVDTDIITRNCLADIKAQKLNPVFHIDMASACTLINEGLSRRAFLGKDPVEDLDLYDLVLDLFGESIKRREQFLIDGFFDRFADMQEEYQENQAQIEVKLFQLAGDVAQNIISRLALDDTSTRQLKNAMFMRLMYRMNFQEC